MPGEDSVKWPYIFRYSAKMGITKMIVPEKIRKASSPRPTPSLATPRSEYQKPIRISPERKV